MRGQDFPLRALVVPYLQSLHIHMQISRYRNLKRSDWFETSTITAGNARLCLCSTSISIYLHWCFLLFSLPSLTFRLLETVAPLVVRQLAVLEGVTGVEERLHAQLILVQVDGTQLRLVQQEVKVHV